MTKEKNILNTTNWPDHIFENVCMDLSIDIGEAIGKGAKVNSKTIDFWFDKKNPAFDSKDRKAVTDAVYAGIGLAAALLM